MRTASLPGAELIEQGLADLALGRETEASLLVSIGAPRLSVFGHRLDAPLVNPEERLYILLRETHGDGAHSQFDALVRRLVNYERALCVR